MTATPMLPTAVVRCCALLAAAARGSGSAHAVLRAGLPEQAVKLVVNFPPGGAADVIGARARRRSSANR